MKLLRNKNTGAIFDWTSALANLDYMEIYEPKMDIYIESLEKEEPIEGLQDEVTHDELMAAAMDVLEALEKEEEVKTKSSISAYKRKK
jgi:hypothetical protein